MAPATLAPRSQETRSEARELAEAVLAGGEAREAVIEGLTYLWELGLVRELAELVNAIRRELECSETELRIQGLVFNLLHDLAVGPMGQTDAETVRWIGVNCPELAAVIRRRSIEKPATAETLTPHECEWFADLWQANAKNFHRFALSRLRDTDDARDVVAELALHLLKPRVYRLMGSYPDAERFRQFAFHNLKWQIRKWKLHRTRKTCNRQIDGPEEQPAYRDPVETCINRPESRRKHWPREDSVVVANVLRNERREAVGRCLDKLRDRDRDVIYFTEGLGATTSEAMVKFGVSKSAIVVVKRRALAVLREHAPAWLKPAETFRETVLRLYHSGVSGRAIAKRTGTVYPNVARLLKREGLPTDRGFAGGRESLR